MIYKFEIKNLRDQGKTWEEIGVACNVNKGVIYKFYLSDKECMNDHSKPRYVNRNYLFPFWEIFERCFNATPHEVLTRYAFKMKRKYSLKINVEALIDFLLDRWSALTPNQWEKWKDKNKSFISKIIVRDIFRFTFKYKNRLLTG